jgi:hypothetical protein
MFKPVAERLSEWENYELEKDHLNARNLKVWSFIFVNLFSVLFYIALTDFQRLSYLTFIRPFFSARGTHACGPESTDPSSLDSHAFTCSSDVFFQVLVLVFADILIIRTLELVLPQITNKIEKFFFQIFESKKLKNKKRISPEGCLSMTSNLGLGADFTRYLSSESGVRKEMKDADNWKKFHENIQYNGILIHFNSR